MEWMEILFRIYDDYNQFSMTSSRGNCRHLLSGTKYFTIEEARKSCPWEYVELFDNTWKSKKKWVENIFRFEEILRVSPSMQVCEFKFLNFFSLFRVERWWFRFTAFTIFLLRERKNFFYLLSQLTEHNTARYYRKNCIYKTSSFFFLCLFKVVWVIFLMKSYFWKWTLEKLRKTLMNFSLQEKCRRRCTKGRSFDLTWLATGSKIDSMVFVWKTGILTPMYPNDGSQQRNTQNFSLYKFYRNFQNFTDLCVQRGLMWTGSSISIDFWSLINIRKEN